MAQKRENVKGRIAEVRERSSAWLECHPKTIAWIAFWLALNYVLDFAPHIVNLF